MQPLVDMSCKPRSYPPSRQPKGRSAGSGQGPHILLVGHVTRDLIQGGSALGGTVAFSARAASTLGLRAAVVTAAPQDFELLAPLRDDPRLEMIEVPTEHETVFALDYTRAGRLLRVRQRAPDLELAHVPRRLRRVPLAYVAPILGECGPELVAGLDARVVLLSLQGALRRIAADGLVMPTRTPLATEPPANLTAAVFSELDHPEAEELAVGLANRGVIVALTRSVRGVSLYTPERTDVPAVPATEVDPTGAGDVFGLIFGLALSRGLSPIEAAQRAVVAAACVVEGPGLGRLGSHIEAHELSVAAHSATA